jgi:DNA-binding MarR family transcriptional regulator
LRNLKYFHIVKLFSVVKLVADTSSQERDELIAELRRLNASMRPPRGHGMAHLMDLDLTFPQLKVMFLLLDAPTARMSALAQDLRITLSACTYLVDRLVTAGYVERSEDPADRRVVQCSLTTRGKDVLDRLRQQSPFTSDEFVERLSIEDLRVLVKATEIFHRVMAEMDS